jgi:soluble lytic murein transglycosylase
VALEPFCDALDRLGGAAEALRRGDAGAAGRLARGAEEALPAGPVRDQAAAILLALAAPPPGGEPASSPVRAPVMGPATGSAEAGTEEQLLNAERLLLQGEAAGSLAQAELAAGSASPALAGRAGLARGLALAALGRFDEAVELARPLAQGSDPGLKRGARWLLARAAARAGRTEEATAHYAAVAAGQAPVPGIGPRRNLELGDEAAYLAAWLWYDAGAYPRAVERLDAFTRARPTSPRADEARWFAAWSLLRHGDRRGAQSRLARLEAGPRADAALYWSGRLSGSRERLRRAALAGGDGWYGWLARRRLEQLHALRPPTSPLDLPPGDLEPSEAGLARLRPAVTLLAGGRREAAVRELEAQARTGADRATAVEICRLATFAGEPALAFRVARDQLGQTRLSERWLYPAAFEGPVAAAGQAAGVDEALLLALVRRESGFRPEARSLAGALGLGQLLPRTAARLGVLAGLDADPAGRLADPATNLALAALYLGLLRDRFGSDAVALAAYNAGPAAPAGWGRGATPLDEWVENVPYRETRHYVKLVLAAREVYRRRQGLPALLDPAALVSVTGAGVAF